MPKKTDSQANRSRQWLLDALLALMGEKPFGDITISEIAARADLDRRTFYRHFRTKEDVLLYHIRRLAEGYETVMRRGAMDARSIALSFFEVCLANRDTVALLHKHRLLPLLLYELNEIFPRYHARYHSGPDPYAPFDTGYALSYHVGGFWNMLLRWVDDGMEKSPRELADTLGSFLPEFI